MRESKDYSAVFLDIIFAFTYALIPFIIRAAGDSAFLSPLVHLRAGAANLFVYPLTCMVMIHLVSSDRQRQDGVNFLGTILWKWYSWPMGILFWICLFFHSVWMIMSFGWGEMIYGPEIYSHATAFDSAVMIAGGVFFFLFSIYLTVSLSGFKINKIGNFISEWLPSKGEALSMVVLKCSVLIFIGPVFLLVEAAILLVIPAYLFCIMWVYFFSRSGEQNKKLHLPFKELPFPAPAGRIILYIYAFLMAFFFDAGVAHMVGISREPGGYMPFWLAALFALGLFYIPYRTFFNLGSGRNKLSWITFFTGIAIVFIETLNRFQH